MFRNPVGEFRLASGKASGHSFRPECEALEERIVPDVQQPSDTLGASSHATPTNPVVVQQAQVLTTLARSLAAKLGHDLQHELDSPAALERVRREGRQFTKLLTAIAVADVELKIQASQSVSQEGPSGSGLTFDFQSTSAFSNLDLALGALSNLVTKAERR